jgi:hypothetical protein
VRPRRLEVEKPLRLDLCKTLRAPRLREVPGSQRRRLRAVVPAPKRGYENRPLELRPLVDAKLVGHPVSLRASRRKSSRRTPQNRHEGDQQAPHGGREPDVDQHELPRQVRPVLELAEAHLDKQHGEHG